MCATHVPRIVDIMDQSYHVKRASSVCRIYIETLKSSIRMLLSSVNASSRVDSMNAADHYRFKGPAYEQGFFKLHVLQFDPVLF